MSLGWKVRKVSTKPASIKLVIPCRSSSVKPAEWWSFEQAEEQLRKEAVAYVEEIVRVYYIAEVLDLELSKKEIRDKKKESGYKVNKKYYGEINIMAALQADKIFDYFLEVKKTEDGEIDKTEDGKKQYVNVKFTIKPDDDDADDADK